VVRSMTSLVASAVLLFAPVARAEGPDKAIEQKIALWRFDALGIEPELVQRLETLFRMELDRLAKKPLPTRREIDRVTSAAEQNCTGEEKCLGAIGRKLGVDVVVTGTVGAMGQNYVLNIKAVDAKTSTSIRRIESEPLRGSPDELIEGVRVAAYRLLAPDQLHGSLQIQSDLVGAVVQLDGRTIGKTPLPNLGVVAKQALGKHQLRVAAAGYAAFEDEVEVRFQKVSQVVVRLLPSTEVIGTGKTAEVRRDPLYAKTWFIVGVGVATVLAGAYIGYSIGKVDCRVINPDGSPGGSC